MTQVETEKLKKQLAEEGKEIDPELEIVIPDEEIQNAMKALADERALRVKAYFLEQGDLQPARVLNCLSSTNLEKDSKPAVELQI